MEIPKCYEIDTEKFKVDFNNEKKVHVAVNKKTGEETNISVLGILMQMGILKPADESDTTREKMTQILKRLESIESKLGIAPQKPIQKKAAERPIEKVVEKPVEKKLIKEIQEIHEEEPEEESKEEPEEDIDDMEAEEIDESEENEKDFTPKPAKPAKDGRKDLLDEIEEESDRILSKEERGEDKTFMRSSGKDFKNDMMESVLEKTMKEEKKEKKPSNAKKESNEEIDNWMEI